MIAAECPGIIVGCAAGNHHVLGPVVVGGDGLVLADLSVRIGDIGALLECACGSAAADGLGDLGALLAGSSGASLRISRIKIAVCPAGVGRRNIGLVFAANLHWLAGAVDQNLAVLAGRGRINADAVLQDLRRLAYRSRVRIVLDQLPGHVGIVDLKGVVADLGVLDVAAGDLVGAELAAQALAPDGVLPVSITGDLEALSAVRIADAGKLESDLPVAGGAVERHGVEGPSVGGAGIEHGVMLGLDSAFAYAGFGIPDLAVGALLDALVVPELLIASAHRNRVDLLNAPCRSSLVVGYVKDILALLAYGNIAAGSLVVAEGIAAALAEYLSLPVTLSGNLEALCAVGIALAGELDGGGPLILAGIVGHRSEGPAVGGACVVELIEILDRVGIRIVAAGY